MMSSVSPLHTISNPGPSGTFYGLGPSSVTTTGETVSSSSTVNCIGVNLSPSLFTTSSSVLPSSTTIATNLTPSTITTNSIVNLINCSTPLPSLENSPSPLSSSSSSSLSLSLSSTIDSNNINNNNIVTNNIRKNDNDNLSIGKDSAKPNVPYSWKREKINDSIVYISPSNCFLWSNQDITDYLLTEGTCKCGLECPIILEEIFNFDPRLPSISLTPTVNNLNNRNHNLDKDKSLGNSKLNGDATFNENNFQNSNSSNGEYTPKTCNHRRRNLISTLNYSTNHHDSINVNSNDSNFSTTSTSTTNTTTTTVNDTLNNQINVRSTSPHTTNQSLQQPENFNNPNHLNDSPTFQHHSNNHQHHQQQLPTNSIPFYPSSHHQSLINPGVTIYKSDENFNHTRDKQPSVSIASSSSSYPNDLHHHHPNITKDFQPNQSPLTTNSYINWLPLNASDDNRLTAIVNENQSFPNTSSTLPGFTDVISGMRLTPTLIDHNPGGRQLVQLYNPVQYTSVPSSAVALLSPAQNRDGSATILIPSLMQSTDHHHHHHQPIVLNSTENVSTSSLDPHQSRNLLPSLRSTPFSSIPLQTPYPFQPQLADSYSPASSPSPIQSYNTVTPTSINENSVSNDNMSENSNRIKNKSKAKSKLIKRRSPRNRKAKENNQRLNPPLMVTDYLINEKQQEPEKLSIDPMIEDKQTIGVDESSSRLQMINDNLINEFDEDDDDEEPMDSQDCDYQENQFNSRTEDDKDDSEYEKIDDSAQCTSEDIMRELSSNENSSIRNVGVQSDELIGEPENLVKSADCSTGIVYSSNDGHEIIKNVTEEEEDDEFIDEVENDEDDDDVYSIGSNLADSEESSEKDDKINHLKTTCEFVLQDDEVNDDSFNELDGDIDNDDDEFDDDTNDNDLLSSDDISINFINSDNNNNVSIISDNNSFDDDDDLEDNQSDDNYDNPDKLISTNETMTKTTITKQLNETHKPDLEKDDNYEEEEEEDDGDDKITISTLINQSSTEKPADEGLYERLSNSNKTTTTTTTINEESTTNRNNKRLERLRKELLCYENNFDQTTAQSPPLSPQVRTFETGDLVWGQMRGNPSWPGKLVNKDDVPGANGEADKGKVWVKWFGDNLVTQVELDKLKTLSEGLEAHHTARKKHRKGKKTDSCLDQAIQEAMMELDKQIDQQPGSSSKTTSTSKCHPPKSSSSSSPPPSLSSS